jgi:HK97 family phage major capsid protein
LVPASSLLTAGAGIVALDVGAKSYNVAAVDTIPTASWRSEAGSVAVSDPTFKNISITPRDLSFCFKVSRELLMDSENIDSALRIAIAQAFAKELDRAGLRGTGTPPEIRGLKNMTGINTVTNGTNGATPTSYANFIAAWKEIVSDNAPAPTAAIMNPRDMATFAGLEDTTGQPLRRPPLLESMRFVQTSQIPVNLTVGTSTDCSEIYVGDFSQFRFYQREGISIRLATELYAETGEIGFFCHTRVDVAALYPASFALVTGVRA